MTYDISRGSSNDESRFDQAISGLSDRLKRMLGAVPRAAKESAFEVRLRVGKPISLTCSGHTWFLDGFSRLNNVPLSGFSVTKQDIEQSVLSLCSYSIHSHQDEMNSGYISLIGGHRAGICGTAALTGGKISAVRDITSINLRIARDIKGAADSIIANALYDGLHGLLIAGSPSSGKTTVLRDLARQLSSGRIAGGKYLKVAVIDERGELGAVFDGKPQNDLGPCCDILSGYPKAEGILTAVRTLSPQVILCDEIGGEEEVSGMLDGINCGVKIIATAHASSLDELLARKQIRKLLEYGVFDRIARLGSADTPGEVVEIVETGDLLDKNIGNGISHALFVNDGSFHGARTV